VCKLWRFYFKKIFESILSPAALPIDVHLKPPGGFDNMKKWTLVLLLAFVVPPQLTGQQAQARKRRVAVLDFDYATVRSNAAAIFGSDIDIGKGITDMLVTMLVKDGTYSVIERKAMDLILAEQNFSNSDRANPASAAKLGKLLGVDAIIVGSITQFGNETQNTNVGGAGRSLGGFGIGGFGKKESSAIVGLDARIVNIDTGEIMVVTEGKGQSKRKSTSLLGGGGNWRGFGAGGVNFGSSDFQQTIIGEAVKLATDQMSAGLIAGNGKIETRQVVVEGLVAAIEGTTVVLNVGAKAGLKVGDKLSIERVSREIKDPATNQVIRRLSSPVGQVEVTELDDISAVAKVVSGAGFKEGDVAKTTTN
jgi:curli biogenesis system outer membrane secretion channel CsgG